ncbi:PP2C family serine/threonine-protein phosphatase [Massilia sp. TS11]|uniref:PP2C family protein-serine/threonine phosphatase n=1 Tax=Massilia sp. TS11 TaxID=2908003 RepID=UPI001EDB04FB|nr:PP2C family serine/threonine-protein phosphatase [Massilia sp. TS11]MCG2582904.1 serine/threonine-protein phosphatase [Massilia sp. TS11]
MQFSVYQESALGARKLNQDRMGYSYSREALLLVLADGMGGHARGEVAAMLAMQTLSTLFQKAAKPYVKLPERFLEEALLATHLEIHRYRAAHQLPDTPRTTIVACLIQHNTAIWAHCGDSRLYWVRQGQLLARTRDHSHIELLIARGEAAPAERHTHPDRNKLYNCLGASTPPQIEISRPASLQPGDVLMVCSDGLWSQLDDRDIAARLANDTIARAVPDMIRVATAKAGTSADNTTALAIVWQGGGAEAHSEITATAHMETLVSTRMMAEDSVSDQMDTAPAADADAFDEDEIERAIAEIRGAIDKSNQVLKGKT